jgi:hypothetical protein
VPPSADEHPSYNDRRGIDLSLSITAFSAVRWTNTRGLRHNSRHRVAMRSEPVTVAESRMCAQLLGSKSRLIDGFEPA